MTGGQALETGRAEVARAPDLLPARMVNEYVYCPRLFYLEWVQGEWADSVDTIEGRFHHRRVDREVGAAPSPGGEARRGGPDGEGVETRSSGEEGEESLSDGNNGEPAFAEVIHARSVLVSSERLRLIARIDLLEGEGLDVTPVDYKHGSVPDTPEQSWEPERVQLCVQGLILRDNGFRCTSGIIYYAASRRRVEVPFTPELEARTLQAVHEALTTAERGVIPPPLVDSPRCPRCSLVGLCLPDETQALHKAGPSADLSEGPGELEVRRLFPARHDALPMYVQEQGAYVRRAGDRLIATLKDRTLADVRVLDVSQLCLFGNVQVSSQALRELASRGIPICHFSYGGWFTALTTGHLHKNVELRRAQYTIASDPARCLELSRRFVAAKALNCRTLLRRNHPEKPEDALSALTRIVEQVKAASGLDSLLGLEGVAARIYYSQFEGMLKPPRGGGEFDFESRNRRPPKDPVNALLSYAYSLLTKDMTVVLLTVGFDPYLGFYHQPKYGKPALALDLMEEFRPIVGDSVVLTAINNGEVSPGDFLVRAGGVSLTSEGRKKFLRAYERRLETLVRHPVFGYTISYRRVFEVQARLLARYLLGEIPEYPAFLTR